MSPDNLSWRSKLTQVREKVVEQEKDREQRKIMEKERSRDSLAERLKRDTPEALNKQFSDLQKRCQTVARKLYPPDTLREQLASLATFGDRLRLYKDAQREHVSLFTAPVKDVINRLLNSMGEIQRSLDKQLGQWQGVEQILNTTAFRARQAAARAKSSDDARLVEIAKSFSVEAYQVTLSLPSDYFTSEGTHFYVADSPAAGGVYGYVRFWPREGGAGNITFSVQAPEKVNFKKLVRGIVYAFCKHGPEPAAHGAILVRISDPREVKFYQELGFRREPSVTQEIVCTADLD